MAGGILVGPGGRSVKTAGTLASGDPSTCCYQQSRYCPSPGGLSGLWLPVGLAVGTIQQGTQCYYFDPADLAQARPCPPALHTGYTSVADCTVCGANPCTCAVDDGGTPPLPITAIDCAEGCYPKTWLASFVGVGVQTACMNACGLTTSYKNNGAASLTASFCLNWRQPGTLSASSTGWGYVRDNVTGGPYAIDLDTYSDTICTTSRGLPSHYLEIDLFMCSNGTDATQNIWNLVMFTGGDLGNASYFFGQVNPRSSCGGSFTMSNLIASAINCRAGWWLNACIPGSGFAPTAGNISGAPANSTFGDQYGGGGSATLTACGC